MGEKRHYKSFNFQTQLAADLPSAGGREGAGNVNYEGPISSWMCYIDQKKSRVS